MSNTPALISYPRLLALEEIPELMGKLIYIIKAYPLSGISVLMTYNQPDTGMKFGDWDGNVIDPSSPAGRNGELVSEFMRLHAPNFIGLMAAAKIKKALFYLSDNNGLQLIDMRTALDKMVGPGMLRDLLSQVIATQTVVNVVGMTPETIETLKKSDDDLIIKPSVFKTITRGEKPNMVMYPMYGTVSRCQKSPS